MPGASRFAFNRPRHMENAFAEAGMKAFGPGSERKDRTFLKCGHLTGCLASGYYQEVS